MKKILLLILSVWFTTLALAATAVVDGITWTYSVSGGKATIGGGYSSPAVPKSTTGAITIPSTLGGYPVTSIEYYAFLACSGLTSVTIPSSVTIIGGGAFWDCSSLTSVTIPSSVTSIGGAAFEGCSRLTSVTIPSRVTSIGGRAFYGCSSLTSVTIPSSVTSIGDYAFERCSSLTSVTIPSSVTEIGNYAFYGCSSLTSVYISDLTAWCEIAFSTGSSNPLNYAKKLYLNGELITNLVIPSSVTSIGGCAFEGYSSLTSVTIPSSVTYIGGDAFYGCSSLTSVYISDLTAWCEIAFSTGSSNPLNYAKKLYLNGELITDLVIPSGVTSIRGHAFYGYSSLTSVTIPEGVASIRSEAFSSCSSLTSVTIPSSVTSIGGAAFRDCSSLTSVTIPEGVTTIGDWTFYGCSSLTSVTIPSSVTSIEWCAFSSCSDLQWGQFLGDVPEGYEGSGLSETKTLFPREYGANWEKVFSASTRGTVAETYNTAVVSVTAEMTTPTTMKVTYTVTSNKETVKVRAVAFKDGVRSFANVVPVKTVAEGSPEAIPNGSAVTANVAHTFVWNVPSDWEEDLAKVAMEILVQEGELLPQELITIPATNTHKAMTITRNTLSTSQAFNALLWCVVEGDSALTVSNGVVKVNGTQIASGASVSTSSNQATALLNYLYGRMGYKVLTGADLTYAEAATRLDLSTGGLTQVAVKIEEE